MKSVINHFYCVKRRADGNVTCVFMSCQSTNDQINLEDNFETLLHNVHGTYRYQSEAGRGCE